MNKSTPPTQPPPKGGRPVESLVLVHTGDGKGKSTAAFGMMVRAVGHGWKPAVIQFIKSAAWQTGEEKAARILGVEWWTLGDGFTWDSSDLERSEQLAAAAWGAAAEIIASGENELVILDEITYPINWGWIDVSDVVSAIMERPARVSIVITGRDAPDELVAIADTVTEMRNIRHAFDSGFAAKKGIDY